ANLLIVRAAVRARGRMGHRAQIDAHRGNFLAAQNRPVSHLDTPRSTRAHVTCMTLGDGKWVIV
ncbi:hypothetical protein J6590_023090, partial [Homalodisca vitripennis]